MAMIPDDSIDEPVITDMNQVEATLSSLCVEMDQRYSLLKAHIPATLKNTTTRSARKTQSGPKDTKFLPYIVVVVDEFGDLIMVSGKMWRCPSPVLHRRPVPWECM